MTYELQSKISKSSNYGNFREKYFILENSHNYKIYEFIDDGNEYTYRYDDVEEFCEFLEDKFAKDDYDSVFTVINGKLENWDEIKCFDFENQKFTKNQFVNFNGLFSAAEYQKKFYDEKDV